METTNTLSPALIDKANQAELLLANKIEQYKSLSINGIDDKDGYRAVREARLDLKVIRIDIEKSFKMDRDKLNVFVKANLSKEKELLNKISPVESALQLQEKAVDDAKEAIRLELERKEQGRIQKRIDELAKYNSAIDYASLKEMTDEQYASELVMVVAKFLEAKKIEDDRLAAIEAEKKAEQERLRKISEEQAVEAGRLQAIADEQSKRASEIKAQQDKIAAEQAEKENQIRIERAKIEAEKKSIEDAKIKAEQEKERKIREEQIAKEAAEKAKTELEERLKREAKEKQEAEYAAIAQEKLTLALLPDIEKAEKIIRSLSIDFSPEVIINDPYIDKLCVDYVEEAEFLMATFMKKLKSISPDYSFRISEGKELMKKVNL